ncbi:MAG: hypothetical protein ACR2NW_07980 [Thermodesulfobacteriota bacterium]
MNLFQYSKYFFIASILVLSTFFIGISISAADDTMQQVEKEMPVLRGDLWIKMSDDEKISFIWGAGHVVTIEEVLMRDDPEVNRENSYIAKVIEASTNSPMKMHEIADKVDAYYEKNPDKLSTPVVEVMWYETIEPRLGKKDNK